jgi:AsmA protein
MKKVLKFIIWLIGIVVVLAIAGVVALTTLVNPNDFKDKISAKVHDMTGRDLVFNGDIHWSFFPWLGVQFNQVQLSNAPGFGAQPFAQIKQVDVKVQLMPLFKRQLEVDKVAVDGLELHLMKNAKGVTNWQDLSKQPTKSAVVNGDATDVTNAQANPIAWVVAGVDVSDGHVTWVDKQKGQAYDVSNIQLKSHTIKLGQAFPIDLSFSLQGTEPKIKTDVQINSTVNASSTKQYTVQGTIRANDLQLNKFTVTNINAPFVATQDLIKLEPFSAKLYQGDCKGAVAVDLRPKAPQIITDVQLTNVQIEPLLQDLATMQRLQLAGAANARVHLVSAGSAIRQMTANGQVEIDNGVIKGVDIPYLIKSGKSLLQRQVPAAHAGPNQTDFGKLTATFVLKNGVVSNQDLLVRSPYLQMTGQGDIDVVQHMLDYKVIGQAVHPDSGQPDGDAIPIMITGTFDNLSIRPDLNALLKAQVQQQLDKQKDKVKDRINVEIGKHLNKELGDQLKNQLNSLFQ